MNVGPNHILLDIWYCGKFGSIGILAIDFQGNAKKKYLHYKLTITNDPLSCDPVDLSQF